MTFELITQTLPDGEEVEVVRETITKTESTVKFWAKAELEAKILEFDSTLERKTVLEEQLKRFKK